MVASESRVPMSASTKLTWALPDLARQPSPSNVSKAQCHTAQVPARPRLEQTTDPPRKGVPPCTARPQAPDLSHHTDQVITLSQRLI